MRKQPAKLSNSERIKLNIPTLPGVYIMKDAAGNIIYIGKAVNLKNRISSYFNKDLQSKSAAIITAMRTISYILCASEREALIAEQQLIRKIKPHFNSMWKDDKSYPYIKFSVAEDFPRLTLTRKKINDKSLYFGPYPQITYIKKLMRWLTKLFKVRPCKINFSEQALPKQEKVKSCIYYHTYACHGPCLGKISTQDYKEKTKDIISFLNGKFGTLKKQWQKEMQIFSDNLQFEEAKDVRDRLRAIANMAERITVSEISLDEMNASISRTNALEELKNVLRLPKVPVVIEGFDISNTQGTFAAASMVRFLNGVADKQNYRHFKMSSQGPDDFAMINEVVHRRYAGLLRKNAPLPDLILIDGGKGQLAAATNALTRLGLNISLISLAEKNEEIYLPEKDLPLKLKKSSQALRLLCAVRDEAHRFALNYHKKLRAKAFLP
ncbi:MAG: excinuclease ABC subunit UvrC [Elusimicrobia bacterium]|nr:excinuclease ABC subunit UvrC [Elusimicrobiota bacterium]